jgi:hypothetical protein
MLFFLLLCIIKFNDIASKILKQLNYLKKIIKKHIIWFEYIIWITIELTNCNNVHLK